MAVNQGTYRIGDLASFDGKFGRYTDGDWKNIVQKMKDGEQIPTADIDLSKLYTARFVRDFHNFDVKAVRETAAAAK